MTTAPGNLAAKATLGSRARAKETTGAKSATRLARPSTASTAHGREARVRVRVYRQGLGDCILVRVNRANGKDFKLMIDCGLVLGVKDKKPADIMNRVVDNLVAETGGEVDALAITHEHWDHLSGFIQAKDSSKKLKVGAVWVAWTEDDRDDLANQLRSELNRGKRALARCALALQAAGDAQTLEMLADIGIAPFGLAGGNSTRAALDAAKSKAEVKTFLPAGDPIEIPGANARFYVLGPPRDGKLIRKINPSRRDPETYGLEMNGRGVLPLGVLAALQMDDVDREGAPFHQRMTIPLLDSQALDSYSGLDANGAIKAFFTKFYYESDPWRRVDADWLGSAPELAMAIQGYTNNTSSSARARSW